MGTVLVAMHALFFVPVALRILMRPRRMLDDSTSTAAPHEWPVLAVHGVGLALLYIGLGFALARGQVTSAPAVRVIAGAGLLLMAALLNAWAVASLRWWRLRPRITSGHELCTGGPYAVVRHPVYLAIDLLGLGTAVWIPNELVLAATLLLLVGGDLRARVEESALLQAFGDRYRAYIRTVARLVPRIY